ncbi:MAG: DUF4838 domain-containing protein [Treponema sp.]|nr:DUF4838 domain-containing protein [Treponema sp.]
MASFDVSLPWVILSPLNVLPAKKAAEELSHYIDLLRRRAGLPPSAPPVEDSSGPASAEGVPLILLNSGSGGKDRNGFIWRAGRERIEIYGESERGLCNGVFDFLAALGLDWPQPDREILPSPETERREQYTLKVSRSNKPSQAGPSGEIIKRRFLLDPRDSFKIRKSQVIWAARNRIDVLVFSLRDQVLNKKPLRVGASPEGPGAFSIVTPSRRILLNLMRSYALGFEGGGWDLSLLLPRRYFFFHRELFRMESGRRVADHHFCPTNPDTIRLIRELGGTIFRANPGIKVFHLWPDRGYEKTWCSCPTCRAFTPAEQNRIAVNAVADALVKFNPRGRISFYEEEEGGEIPLRPNLFRLEGLPEKAGAGAVPWLMIY